MIFTTCPNEDTAREIATTLVNEGFAACIQIQSPVTSIYRWEGKTVTETECLLSIKSTHAAYLEVEERILRLHPYDLPEIIAIDIVKGLPKYLRWIEETTCKK